MPRKTSTPEVLKLKTCEKLIRKDGKHIKCEKQYLGDESNCPNRSIHLTKYPTGFCNDGCHEGTKVKSYSGRNMKTCANYVTCPCQCHDDLDKLFSMTGTERILVDSSGYVPEPNEFWHPSDDPDYVSSIGDPVDGPLDPQGAPVSDARAGGGRSYAPTPTGRAARGQLESWVHAAFQVWLVDSDGQFTPNYVQDAIKRTEAVEASVGAIDAVFKRWEKIRFATMEKKPTRLTGLTPEGQTLGLERLKAKLKREGKMERNRLKRGIR